jgi:iron complex transport system ATP-binding protein
VLTSHDLKIGYALPHRQHRAVAEGLNLKLEPGQFVCLIGPNGAGKSTLLRTLTGMQKPLDGDVHLDGENLHRIPPRLLAQRLSVVLTERVTVGLLNAYTVVSLGRYPYTNWNGKLSQRDHDVIQWSLEAAGAADLASRNISELSDGERQKVMLARALAQEPKLMVLDEITAFLDLPRRVEIMNVLRGLAHREKRAILLSSHDLDLALRSADEIWLLSKGGSFCSGTPEELVLDGAFQRAFSSEGVSFHSGTGTFEMPRANIGELYIEGEGDAAFWTRRAFERCGYSLVTAGTARIEVRVVDDGANRRWQIRNGREFLEASSLPEATATVSRCMGTNR